MAVLGRDIKILIDQFDFSGASNAASGDWSVPELDNSGFQADALTFEPGLSSGKLTHKGYYDGDDAGDLEKELRDRLGTASAVHLGVLLDDTVAYVSAQAWQQQVKLDMPLNDLITIEGSWPGAMNWQRGRVLFDGTLDATGEEAAVDVGAAGSAGGIVYVWVQSIAGTATGAEVDVESSATEGGTYASEATVTFSAVGGFTAAMTGTVNRWLRINCTDLGGATAVRLVVAACVAGVTY